MTRPQHGSTTPYTVILGDGLTEEVLGPQVRHRGSRTHVGEREVERLLGRGRDLGCGPLPAFLERALEESGAGRRVGVILLAPDATEGNGRPAEPRFAPPLDRVAERCRVLRCAGGRVPWEPLRGAVLELAGVDPTVPPGSGPGLRFLVVGCHTEGRILALATFLRLAFQCGAVAISPHLVGSALPEAHLAVLRHNLPGLGVDVLLDLADAARFAHLRPPAGAQAHAGPCAIEPAELRERLDAEQRQIIERLCMHWTRAHLRTLSGGFSGSLLLMAEGWKGSARTEPLVLKIDAYPQMRCELSGYYLIKDFLGKHVPAFGYPVAVGERLGVGMELAAMEGAAETLQESFERAEDEDTTWRFIRRLEKTLELLVDKLLHNTRELDWVVPYRDLGLHAEKQQRWLRENAALIGDYLAQEGVTGFHVGLDRLVSVFRLITANENGLESEVCLCHGDLNFANVIGDGVDNLWLIDWTHSARMPLELDFAKLENDTKFVLDAALELEDLSRLCKLDEYLVRERVPARADRLPPELSFVKWDLRFRKILGAVRRIREACFALKGDEDWLVYRVALLRYATHTLSFDRRRGRGECGVMQLAAALHSVEELAYDLFSEPFHMRIRAERPEGYPPRVALTIDEAPWEVECPGYAPPYWVAPAVLDGHGPGGWADPEDLDDVRAALAARPARQRDAEGRPLNPRGRTGIAGRGLLGLWGVNLSVAAVLVRPSGAEGELEVALGHEAGTTRLELPKGFVLPGEDPADGLRRVLRIETGCSPAAAPELLIEEPTYDPRQTDHAWVETRVLLYFDAAGELPDLFAAGGDFEAFQWWPLNAATVNRLPSGQAGFLRAAVERMKGSGRLAPARAELLLASTG